MIPEGIGTWPQRRRVKSGAHPAVVFRGRTTSYAELADRVDRLATGLQQRGISFGDRVAYLGNNHPSLVETLFATTMIGAIFVPLNTRLAAAELAHQLADCNATALVFSSSLARLASEAFTGRTRIAVSAPGAGQPPANDAADYETLAERSHPSALTVPAVTLDDPALIIYTSGTTGAAKGAVLTHGNLTWNTLNVVADYDLVGTDRALILSPLFHVASLGMGCLPVILKGATLLLDEGFVAARALRAIECLRATTVSGVPTTFQLILDAPEWAATDISSLRLLTCGGSPVPERVRLAYQERGLAFSCGYGMTETSPGVTMLPAWHAAGHLDSAGLPHFFTEYRVRSLHSNSLADPGEGGEIEVRGPNVFSGYWKNAEATRAAFTPDGWLRTGDVGVADADGFLRIVDRVKDMIISGGENVYAAEVELAILETDEITGVAVIGLPDARWGEVPHAVVTLADGATLDVERLVADLSRRLARYKVPRTVKVVDQLPRTATGKVQKNVLRQRLHDL